MLHALTVRNYTLIESLDLELEAGLTCITGETGAGKSIVLDALGLSLGNRADAKTIRKGAERLEVCAVFDLSDCPDAAHWLRERELDSDNECQLRRTVTADGRSRAWINGQSATMSDLKAIGDMLVDLHGQHEHHSLLKRQTQELLLDEFGGHRALARSVTEQFRTWQHAQHELAELQAASQERADRLQLLNYQLTELDELDLQPGEIEQLEQTQRLLAHADETAAGLNEVLAILNGDDNGDIIAALRQAQSTLAALKALGSRSKDCVELLENARIQLEEARREIVHLHDGIERDPERLESIETRLSDAFQQARKHRVKSEELPALREQLNAEVEALNRSDESVVELERHVQTLLEDWQDNAAKLTKARKKAAASLTKKVASQLGVLGMQNCELSVDFNALGAPSAHGAEQIEFLVSTNPGATPDSLAKVASGGELSRISLAIQVITAGEGTTPTIIFDEVDVGIGGATADAVGDLLQSLGARCQVICVTHLPQVAARGTQQLRASKSTTDASTNAALERLDGDQRVEEIGRMLGTRTLTETTLRHAREMLEAAGTL